MPKRIWYFNNTLLDFKNFKNINETVYVNTNKRSHFVVDGCLNIKTETNFLSGLYMLRIKNKFGEVNKTIAVFLDSKFSKFFDHFFLITLNYFLKIKSLLIQCLANQHLHELIMMVMKDQIIQIM